MWKIETNGGLGQGWPIPNSLEENEGNEEELGTKQNFKKSNVSVQSPIFEEAIV